MGKTISSPHYHSVAMGDCNTMNADAYISSIIKGYRVLGDPVSAGGQARKHFSPVIKQWAGPYLLGLKLSGSCAKGTAIKGSSDADLFISLRSTAPGTLGEIYENLYEYICARGYCVRRQNVSIGVEFSGMSVDIIPARKQPGKTSDHSLFKRKTGSWTQTNVQEHVDIVRKSYRLNEIRAMKIWRNLNGLEFPSFYLEMTVLTALSGRHSKRLSNNVWQLLTYLRDDFVGARVLDPANSNNVVSDDLSHKEKSEISTSAALALEQSDWSDIIW